jgi:hypothetical protein
MTDISKDDLHAAFEKNHGVEEIRHRDQLQAIQGLAEEIRGLALSVVKHHRNEMPVEQGGSNWAIATFTIVILSVLSLGWTQFSSINAMADIRDTHQSERTKSLERLIHQEVEATELRSNTRHDDVVGQVGEMKGWWNAPTPVTQ